MPIKTRHFDMTGKQRFAVCIFISVEVGGRLFLEKHITSEMLRHCTPFAGFETNTVFLFKQYYTSILEHPNELISQIENVM